MNTRDPGAIVLDCRRCGAQIRAEDINLVKALAKCRHCHAVFGFADQMSGARPAPPPTSIPLPRGLDVSERSGVLRLERHWFQSNLFFLLIFCVCWDAFMVLWYINVLSELSGRGLVALFPLLFVAAGAGMTYVTLAGLINSTVIEAGKTHLALRHTPLPWRGNREIWVSELQQIFCEEHVRESMNGSSTTYSLNAVLVNGRKLTLVKDLPEAAQALYLEHAIEKYLGITNRPVPGELRP
jgi:hypothetical protein